MFIINPDKYSLPCYRIGPFTTRDLAMNAAFPERIEIDQYFENRFDNNKFIYTENGRRAINDALSYYKLDKDDVVTILTTTNNFYISGCVTKEIEKFCKWSRQFEDRTKIIFVNHEFGYPYPDLTDLKKYNLPIIEDCANSFFSIDEEKSMGSVGDFAIYSFPKMFPIQVGGLLRINITDFKGSTAPVTEDLLQYIRNVLSRYIGEEDKIKSKRIHNYLYLQQKFTTLGFEPRFQLKENSIPGVFMFRVPDSAIDLPCLKNYFQDHGIQCSVFYGERTFFIPCHQNLEEPDLDYFTAVMQAFLRNQIEINTLQSAKSIS